MKKKAFASSKKNSKKYSFSKFSVLKLSSIFIMALMLPAMFSLNAFAFEFYGTTYYANKTELPNANVTIEVYNFSNMNGPPVPIAYYSNLSNASGSFYINVPLEGMELAYKAVIRHFSANGLDMIGPSLPEFPFFEMQSLSPINFFLKPGITLNITAQGDPQQNFNASPENITLLDTSQITGMTSISGLEWNNNSKEWAYTANAQSNKLVILNYNFSYNRSYNLNSTLYIRDISLVNDSLYFIASFNQSNSKALINIYEENSTSLILNKSIYLDSNYTAFNSMAYDSCTGYFFMDSINYSGTRQIEKFYFNGTSFNLAETFYPFLQSGKLARDSCNSWYISSFTSNLGSYDFYKTNNSFDAIDDGFFQISFNISGMEIIPGYGGLSSGLYAVDSRNMTKLLTPYDDGTKQFNYYVKDTKLGYPLAEYFNMDSPITEATVYLPRDRNYSIMLYPDQSFPVSYSLNNMSANNEYQASSLNNIHVSFNTTQEWVWVSGYALYNNASGFEDFKIINYLIEPGNMVFTDHPLPFNMSSWRRNGNFSDIYDNNTGFYNITLPASAMGSKILMFAVAKNGTSYYGNFKNITLTIGSPNIELNFSLQEMPGIPGDIQVDVAHRDNYVPNGMNISAKLTYFNLTNGSTSPNSAHVEIELDYRDIGGAEFTFIGDLEQDSNGLLYFPLLMHDIKKINVFTPEFAPIKTSKLSSDLASQPVNILMRDFNPGSIDQQSFMDLSMDMLKSSPECNVPEPSQDCSLMPQTNFSEFNPLKIVMSGAPLSFRMTKLSSNITIHYKNVDMLASGPPDAMFDSNASSQSSGTAIEEAWRFGSQGPEIYDEVLIGFPYDPSLNPETITAYIGELYDNNWNVVWNTSNSTSEIPEEFSDFNISWFNSTTGMECSTTDENLTSSDCYIDTSKNMMWITIPHFTGVGTVVGGSSYENASLVIWDETDPEAGSQLKYVDRNIIFYANYTNETSGEPIDNTKGNCTILFETEPNQYYNMTWNSTNSLWQYTKSFSSNNTYYWNVTCNATYFNSYQANDTVTVLMDTTSPILNYNSTNATSAAAGDSIKISTNWTESSYDIMNMTCYLFIGTTLNATFNSTGSWCNYTYTVSSYDYPGITIKVNASDKYNNTGQGNNISITVSSELNSPIANYNITNSSVEIGHAIIVETNWSDQTLSQGYNLTVVLYKEDGTMLNSTISRSSWANNSYLVSSSDYPVLRVYANATDQFGNTGMSSIMSISLTESDAPGFIYNSTNATSLNTGDSVYISTNWSDFSLSSYNMTCRLYIDNSLNQTINSTGSWCNFTYTASAYDYPNITIYVNATDEHGNTNKSDLIVIEVNDTAAPVITINNPLNNSIANNSYFYLNFSVFEPSPNTASFCNYSVYNSSSVKYSNSDLDIADFSRTGYSYNYAVKLQNMTNNEYFAAIICKDTSNRTDQKIINFTALDTVNPRITSYQPTGDIETSSSSITVTLSATTDEYTKCRYATTNIPYGNMSNYLGSSTQYSLTHTKEISYGSDQNNEQYYVVCQDMAKRNSSSQSISYDVDVSRSNSSSSSSGSSGSSSLEIDNTNEESSTETIIIAKKFMSWGKIKKGQNISFKPGDEKIPVSKMFFESGQAISYLSFEIKAYKSRPKDAKSLKNAFKYLEIKPSSFKESYAKSGVTIEFKVNKSWVEENAASKEKVYLYRLVNGEWQKLNTSFIKESQGKYIYESITPGFSYFAIGAEEKPIVQPENPETKGEENKENKVKLFNETQENKGNLTEDNARPKPNQEIFWPGVFVLAILVMLAIVLAFRKKSKKQKKNKAEKPEKK